MVPAYVIECVAASWQFVFSALGILLLISGGDLLCSTWLRQYVLYTYIKDNLNIAYDPVL
jgi:hypothetical protein